MNKFSLPYYNISGCDAEQNEDRLIEWLAERTECAVQRTRTINTFNHGYTTVVPADSPDWERYWDLAIPGGVELINLTGCSEWMHYRVSRFLVLDNGHWIEFPNIESECYFEIADEYLALQFKLIL
jgi:hypothetical protein